MLLTPPLPLLGMSLARSDAGTSAHVRRTPAPTSETHPHMTYPTRGAGGAASAVDPNEFRVTRLRALRGPNYWRLAPVIACDLRLGALEEVSSADMPHFTPRLLEAIPSLHEHPCSRGESGGF